MQDVIPASTCVTLTWAILYNSMSRLHSGCVKEIHVNDRWLVIHHRRHLGKQEEITVQVRCHFLWAATLSCPKNVYLSRWIPDTVQRYTNIYLCKNINVSSNHPRMSLNSLFKSCGHDMKVADLFFYSSNLLFIHHLAPPKQEVLKFYT